MTSESFPAPFETPGGRPIIATIGEVFDDQTIGFIQLAADELNSQYEQSLFTVEIDDDSYVAPNGSMLPEGKQRIRVTGSWTEDKDIAPLWSRVKELQADFAE